MASAGHYTGYSSTLHDKEASLDTGYEHTKNIIKLLSIGSHFVVPYFHQMHV